jgi:hypothetical protein
MEGTPIEQSRSITVHRFRDRCKGREKLEEDFNADNYETK